MLMKIKKKIGVRINEGKITYTISFFFFCFGFLFLLSLLEINIVGNQRNPNINKDQLEKGFFITIGTTLWGDWWWMDSKLTCASKALNPPGPRQSIFNHINIIGVDPPINKTLQKHIPLHTLLFDLMNIWMLVGWWIS